MQRRWFPGFPVASLLGALALACAVGMAAAPAVGQAQNGDKLQGQDRAAEVHQARTTAALDALAGDATSANAGTAGTSGSVDQPQPLSNADQNPGGANNGGDCGAYCSTRDGSPSLNGSGNGAATGEPCAGCVGKADNKNPPGQQPNGTDANAGYECDRNHGIGQTNPAHTGCVVAAVVVPSTPPQTPETPQTPQTPQTPETPHTPQTPSGPPSGPPTGPPNQPNQPANVLPETVVRPVAPAQAVAPTQAVAPAQAVAPQSAPNNTLAATAPKALPTTGTNVLGLLWGALAMLGLGTACLYLGRGRRPSTAITV